MKNKLIVPIFLLVVGMLAIGVSSKKPSSLYSSETMLSENKEIKVKTKTIYHDSEEIQINIALPIFFGGPNKELLEKINSALEEDAVYLKEELLDMAKNDFESSTKENINFRKYELLVSYEIHTMNNELISWAALNYQYTGGAHGISIKIPYNFDLAIGKELLLNDLFKQDSDYKKIINEEIQKQIQQEPDKFYLDEVEVFSGIKEDQGFYIKDGKLFIYFGQYDIAPYSSGIIEFEIPSNILKNVVSSSFIK